MAINVDINFQPKQFEAFQSLEHGDALYTLYGGAKGGGKSYLVRTREIIRRMRYAGTDGVIIRRTHPELYANHIQKMLTEFPFIVPWYRAGDKLIKYPNGSITFFKHLDSTKDVYGFQGLEYDDMSLDEATQHEEEVFTILKTSLRIDPKISVKNLGFKPKFLLTGNPGGIGHEWVMRRFIERNFNPNETPEDFHFIQAKIWDNPLFLNANPQYLRNLQDLPEYLRKAYLDGDWYIFAGRYFKKLRYDKHVIDPCGLDPSWLRFRSLDWGYNHPTVCLWWALDFRGNAYIYRAYRESEYTVGQMARNIVAMTPRDENIVMTLVGHDMRTRIKTEEVPPEYNMMDEAAANGLYCSLANTERVPGWQALMHLIEWNDDPTKGRVFEPRLKIFKHIDWVYKDLAYLIHSERNPEDVEKMPRDDTGDSARYGAAHIFKTRLPEPEKCPQTLFEEEITEDVEMENWETGT